MKVKFEGQIYDVVDGYSQGYIIEKPEREYRYVGKHKRDCEVVDNSPINYVKTKQFLPPKKTSYSKTVFMDKNYEGTLEMEDDTIIVFNNVIAFYSPAKHTMLVLDIAPSKHSEGKHIWGFEKHDDNTISLHPSIRYTQHEHSEHFFIKRNQVVNWCQDSWENIYVKTNKREKESK